MNEENKSTWEMAKEQGSPHYKTGGVEPIDLYRSGGMFRDFALCSIIKYAFRNRSSVRPEPDIRDLNKIIHYARLLMGDVLDGEDNTL